MNLFGNEQNFSDTFFSFQSDDTNFASQLMVYKDIGEEMLEHAFEGKAFNFMRVFSFPKLGLLKF